MAQVKKIALGRRFATLAIRSAAPLGAFASTKVTLTIALAIAVACGCAATLQNRLSVSYARWYVYESRWFIGLLALLATHSLCAVFQHLVFKPRNPGQAILHSGLLVLLGGAVQSYFGTLHGEVRLRAGESTQEMMLPDCHEFAVSQTGRPQQAPLRFRFSPGPADWASGKVASLGEQDGVRVRVLNYFRRPQPIERWLPDARGQGGPVVRFKVLSSSGEQMAEGWLSDQQFGDAIALGPLRVQLEQAVSDAQTADFRHLPADGLGDQGLLCMYLGETVERVRIDQRAGKRIAIGDTGVHVQIAEYLPHAAPDRLGNFTTKSDQPKNPMVELRVHLPNEASPIRQIAFAKDPFLNLDRVYPRTCPVKFRFYHPAIRSNLAVELLQDSRGKLAGRVCSSGRYTSLGELRAPATIPLPNGCTVEIVEHLAHGQYHLSYSGDGIPSGTTSHAAASPAAFVEVNTDGSNEQVWLKLDDPTYGQAAIGTLQPALLVRYQHARVPLGFSMELAQIPGNDRLALAARDSQSVRVRLGNGGAKSDHECDVVVGQPLHYRNLRILPVACENSGHGPQIWTFNVTSNPPRGLIYGGAAIIFAGLALSAAQQNARTRGSVRSIAVWP